VNTLHSTQRVSICLAMAATLLFAADRSAAQLPKDPVERAKVVAQIFELNASQLTLFDRTGKELSKIGPRGMYDRPVLSPDGKRVVVIKGDIDKETRDVWVVDVATGASTQVTANQPREAASTPTWSPDSTEVAYVALRTGTFGLFHKSADGTGPETLEYKSSAPIDLVDWSLDGKYLSFFRSDLGGSVLLSLPLDATGEKKPIELVKSPFRLQVRAFHPMASLCSMWRSPAELLRDDSKPSCVLSIRRPQSPLTPSRARGRFPTREP